MSFLSRKIIGLRVTLKNGTVEFIGTKQELCFTLKAIFGSLQFRSYDFVDANSLDSTKCVYTSLLTSKDYPFNLSASILWAT